MQLNYVESSAHEAQTSSYDYKEIVDASLQDITGEKEFVAAVQQGLSELDNGDTIPIEEIEEELPSWIIR